MTSPYLVRVALRAVAAAAVVLVATATCPGEGPVPPGVTHPNGQYLVRAAAPLVGDPGPRNGTDIIRRDGSGPGEFSIRNGTEGDAVVTLARNGAAQYAVYVGAGRSTRITDVADGTYTVFATYGIGWNASARDFAVPTGASRFDRAADFRTVREDGRVVYSTVSVTLHQVPGGNTTVTPLRPIAVPR